MKSESATPLSFNLPIDVRLVEPLSAVQWLKHGDHPHVSRMNGSNWEYFPNENDDNHGLLCGVQQGTQLIESGDWIVYSSVFNTYAVFKPEEYSKHFRDASSS